MTKDEMTQKISELNGEIASLKNSVQIANEEMRRFQADATRHERGCKELEQKLAAIRTVVNASLRVDYGVGVNPVPMYIDCDKVVCDNDCREVRLLRCIYELSETRPPF